MWKAMVWIEGAGEADTHRAEFARFDWAYSWVREMGDTLRSSRCEEIGGRVIEVVYAP